MLGVVIGVRNRDCIESTVRAFQKAGALVAVVEQNNTPRLLHLDDCLYKFIQTSDVYSRSRSNNIGFDMLKEECQHIWFSDADILINKDVVDNLKPHLEDKILFPSIDGYSTGAHTGNMIVPTKLVKDIIFNEDIVGWGYEDDDYLHQCRGKGIELVYGINVGKITHLSSSIPEKAEHLFPGCKKWNNWGHNVIISDYSLGIPEDSPGFGVMDVRRSFPKDWMDRKDLYI